MKIVILSTWNIDEFEYRVIEKILDSNHQILGWFIDSKKPVPLFQKLKNNLKRGRGGYVIIMAFKSLFKKNKFSRDISQFVSKTNAEVYKIDNINNYSDTIKELNADVLILINGFGLIKKNILNLCKYGVISYHHGDMRKYRGQPPGFWELYNNENEMSVTVQKLDEGLDCGEPVSLIQIPIRYKDTLSSLQKRFYSNSSDLMVKALDYLDKNPVLKKLDNYGKVYTLPNLSQWLFFNFKIAFRKINFLRTN